jgi:DNA-binding GntR family transcriptional regulator
MTVAPFVGDMTLSPLEGAESALAKTDPTEEQIARAIEREIVFGDLVPGQKLREEELAARFAASRHQVRQGLALLVRAGIVTRERNRGASVRSFSADEVRQIYEIRELLQRQAALRIRLPASEEEIERLRLIQSDYERAIGEGDVERIHAINEEFHGAFFRLCRNDILVQLVKTYMDLSYVIRANAFSDHESLSRSALEHSIMIALLGGTDAWALAQICVDHIQLSKIQYLAKFTRAD